jgi:hypothetical protein
MRTLHSVETSGSDYRLTQRHYPRWQKYERQCIFFWGRNIIFKQLLLHPVLDLTTCRVWPRLQRTGKRVRYFTRGQPSLGFGMFLYPTLPTGCYFILCLHTINYVFQYYIRVCVAPHRLMPCIVASHVFLVSGLPAYILRCCFPLIRRVVNNQ